MKTDFWGKMSDEYLKDNPEPPPLTDTSLAAFEQRAGLKLPKMLTDLLRVKNGGLLQNTDFRFHGKGYEVTYIKAVASDDSYDSIRSYTSILSDTDSVETREQLQGIMGPLNKLLYVAEPSGYPFGYVLNYNKLNSHGEPTIWCIGLEFGEPPSVKQIADSFAEFLAGQYFGDELPIVDLKEADKYRLVAKGGYEGRYEGEPEPERGVLSGLPVKVRWKICSHRNRLIVFQDIDWAGQKEIRREEIHKAALTLDFPELESYGVELEPELAEMIRPAVEVEVISQSEIPVIPKIWVLLLHIQMGDKRWVKTASSSLFQGRWKNEKSKILYSSIKSASRSEVEKTLRAVAASCAGLRRWFG